MSNDDDDLDTDDEYRPHETQLSSRRDVRILRAFGVGKRRRGAARQPPGLIDEGFELPDDLALMKRGMPKTGLLSGPLREKPTAMKTMASMAPRWRRNAILTGCAAVIVAAAGPALPLGGLEVVLAIVLAAAVIPVWIRGKREYQRQSEIDNVIEDLRPYLGMERSNRTAIRIRHWHASLMPGTGRGTPRRIILYHSSKLRVNPEKLSELFSAACERQGWGPFVLFRYDDSMNRLIYGPAVLDESDDDDYMSATEAGPIDIGPSFDGDGDGVVAPGPARLAWRPPSQGARLAAERAETMADEAGVWSGRANTGNTSPQSPAAQPRLGQQDFSGYTPPQYTFDSPPPQPRRSQRSRDTLLSDGGLLGDSLIGGDNTGNESAAESARRRAEAAALFNGLGVAGSRGADQRPGQTRLRLVQDPDEQRRQ